jgi:8-oxo-dGTP pyrophosphatase MutT (NUDIX family)
MITALAGFGCTTVDRPDLTAAAVCICVVQHQGAPSMLITRRSSRVRAHANQWALPGGKLDGGESAVGAALRELREETGLVCTDAAVLGVLDDYVSRSGYVITPVVVWADDTAGLRFDPSPEVARTYLVPLVDLDVEPTLVQIPESPRPVIQLPLFDRLLHAPTAAIVYQFCQVALHGKDTRVSHFEQPVFAWR